jgi:hypothetical protein
VPKPKAEDPRRSQVLVRFTDAEMAVLTAVAHLEGVTPNAYVYAVVSDHAAALASNPNVQADIANRRAYTERHAIARPLTRP